MRRTLSVLLSLWICSAAGSRAAAQSLLVGSAQLDAVAVGVKHVRENHERLERERKAVAAAQNAAVACLEAARRNGVPVADAVKLCSSAKPDQAPASCYAKARAGNVAYVEALKLCRCNPNSEAPALCYAKAREYNVAYLEAVELCTGATDNAPAECYRSARLSNVAYRDAVTLCKP